MVSYELRLLESRLSIGYRGEPWLGAGVPEEHRARTEGARFQQPERGQAGCTLEQPSAPSEHHGEHEQPVLVDQSAGD